MLLAGSWPEHGTGLTAPAGLIQAAGDSARAAQDSAAAPPDTAVAPQDTAVAPPDTAFVPGQRQVDPAPPDSIAAGQSAELAARIDSLAAAVRALAEAQRAAGSSPPDTSRFQTAQLEETARQAQRFGLRTVMAILILSFAFVAVRALTWLLDLLAERHAARRLLYKRLVPIVRVVVWAFTAFVIIRGIYALEARTLLAAGAAIGVAIGFAAQDVIKNIFGGLMIIIDRPFQAGDKIQVGDTYGEVTAIGLRATRIVTPDDSVVSVPNARVLDGAVSNANSGALDCQVVTDLWLPGWVDVRKARRIAYRAAVTSRYVYLRKPVVVIVKDEVHHTFLTHLRVKAYVQDIRHEFLFMSDVTERARAAFVEAGLLPEWHGALPLATAPGRGRESDGDAAAPAPSAGPIP